MRRLFFTVSAVMLLSGCGGPALSTNLEEHLKNPLFAERYAEILVDRLVNLEIMEDPLLEDPIKKAAVEEQRRKWLEVARVAREKQREGTSGLMIGIGEDVAGEMLYVNDMLYFGTLFEASPGVSLHVYLTSIVDPRDSTFPDDTAIDLGPLQSAYGDQAYTVPPVENSQTYRTVVLWDTTLERLHSFAQLSR